MCRRYAAARKADWERCYCKELGHAIRSLRLPRTSCSNLAGSARAPTHSIGGLMRKSRFTEEQIIAALQERERGAKIADLCRKLGITETTFHRWRRKYGGLEVSEARRLKVLEEEHRRLKQLVADQAPDNRLLKELLGKQCGDGRESADSRSARARDRRSVGPPAESTARLPASGAPASDVSLCSAASFAFCLTGTAACVGEQRPRSGYRRLCVLLRREGLRTRLVGPAK